MWGHLNTYIYNAGERTNDISRVQDCHGLAWRWQGLWHSCPLISCLVSRQISVGDDEISILGTDPVGIELNTSPRFGGSWAIVAWIYRGGMYANGNLCTMGFIHRAKSLLLVLWAVMIYT